MRNCLFAAAMLASTPAVGEVVRVEVREQRPWVQGRTFGAGAYELVAGTVRYEVDPAAAASKDITDIALGPRNARGRVEFSGPFMLLRPADPTRANGTTLFEVANRGTTQLNGTVFDLDSLSLTKNATRDVTRSALFDLGYTFAWAGWQGDLKGTEFGLTVPKAPVMGWVRSAQFLGLPDGSADAGQVTGGWCAAKPDDPRNTMRVHASFDDPGRIVPRAAWRFARREKDGSIVPDPCAFLVDEKITSPALVTVVYETRDPPVMGLGQAAVRDFVSHLRGGGSPSALNTRGGDARRTVAFGYSQSARFLRDFLYRGFNADAQGRKVFDGVMDTAAGAGRGSFNHRFALPGQAGNSVGSALRAVDLYPFADVSTADVPGGARSEGLLDRAIRDRVQPRIMHILSSSEYWARAGSLLHTTTDGRKPLPEAPGTRTYAFSGTPHGPRSKTSFLNPDAKADYPYNDSEDMFLALPALLEAMRKWVSEGTEPPASVHPRLGTTLVAPATLAFPKVPGVKVPVSPPPIWQLNFGSHYRTRGIIAEPPVVGPRYPLLVPQVDGDGNELGSWRGLTASVPLGTYTAWNRYNADLDGFGYLSGLQGAFIPFAITKGEREERGDPRASVVERYNWLGGYMAAVDRAIAAQTKAGFLLERDHAHARTHMRMLWDRTEALLWHWPPPEPTAAAK